MPEGSRLDMQNEGSSYLLKDLVWICKMKVVRTF
ncbi:hypothetical protein AbauAttikon1_0105 [Acinetobacter phage Abau_Attikon1]